MKKITLIIIFLFVLTAQKFAYSQIVTDIASYATTSLVAGTTGNEFILPVTATVTATTSIGSYSLVLNYDPTIVTATLITKGSATGSSGSWHAYIGPANSLPVGQMLIEWAFGNKNLAIGGNNIANITFRKVAAGNTANSFLVNDCQYANSAGTPYVNCTYVNGNITFQTDAPHTSATLLTACPGSVSIPIIVNNFNTIGSVSLTLLYNSSALSYTGYSGDPGFSFLNVNGSTAGKVVIGALAFGDGITLANGETMLTLNFTYNGGYTDLSWDSSQGTLCDYANADPAPVVLPDSPFSNYYTAGSLGPNPTTWLGGTSTAWDLRANWSCDVPMSHTDVTIPSGKPRYPVINSSGAAVNSLTIDAGSVTINPGADLTVATTLTNNAGTSGLVVNSDASGTGSLKHNTDNVQGTIKRYITGNASSNLYHQVSVPLAQSSNPTSNLFLGSYLFDFNEGGSTSGSWNALGTPTNTPLNSDKGYLIYYPNPSITYTFAGPLRNGTVNPVLSFTNVSHGYNLVPNPYPSAIDWSLIATKTNLADAIWIWNQATSNYGAYGTEVGTGTSGTSKYIPVGQSFFVRAKASSPVLTLTNAARVHNSQTFLKSTESYENKLRLVASANNASDEILVAFNDNWNAGADNADVDKMVGGDSAPQLSCVSTDGDRLSIDALPFSSQQEIIPLDFSLNATTDVTFTASGMDSFLESISIYLEDQLLGQMIDLRANPSYTFSNTAGSSGNRFQLRFMGVTGTPEQPETSAKVFASNGHLYIDAPSMNQSEVTIAVFDAIGRLFSSKRTVINGITELSAPVTPGIYVVRLMNGTRTITGKVVIN